MSQLRHFVDTPRRKLSYHALNYASTVWDGCSDILFNKLNSLHRRAATLMISDSSLTTDTKLQHFGLLPLKEKLIFIKAVLVLFKAYRNRAPPYLKQLFVCSRTRRATYRFITLPKPRIDFFKTCLSFSGYPNSNKLMQFSYQLQNTALQIVQKQNVI